MAALAALDIVVLVIACGPTVVTAARRIRRTPGWPFVVGAAIVIESVLRSAW